MLRVIIFVSFTMTESFGKREAHNEKSNSSKLHQFPLLLQKE